MTHSRKLRAQALAAPLLMLALAGGAATAAPPTVVGVTAAILNDVRIKSAAARLYAKAVLRQRVALADQVQTGTSSRLQLLLLDQSKFTVGPNARLTIDRFVYDPNGGSLSATVAKGAFRFMSGRSSPNKQATINSPSASIGIRGTLLDGAVGQLAWEIARGERELRGNVRHDPATATLVVLRGPGPRRQGNDRVGAIDVTGGGQTVTLDRPLQAAYVPYAGATPIVFTISSPGIARLNDMLFEPQSVLYDPNAAPILPPPGNDRPRYDYYDRPPPPPPGMLDGPGPSFNGGNYIPNMPGMNGYPGNYPDRPTNPRGRNQSTTPGTSQPPPTTTTNNGATSQPPPTTGGQGTRLYLPDDTPSSMPPPTTTPQSTVPTTTTTPQSTVPSDYPTGGHGNIRPSGNTGSPPPTTGVTGNSPPPTVPSDSLGDPYGSQTPTTDPGAGSLKPSGRPLRPTRTPGVAPTGSGTPDQPVQDSGGGANGGVSGGSFKPIGPLKPVDKPILKLPPKDPAPPIVK